jgi:hypothetical protein
MECAMMHDRGALERLTFQRCIRGFTLSAYDIQRDDRTLYAFDRIEDLAAWLVEEYAPASRIEARSDETENTDSARKGESLTRKAGDAQ